MSRFANERMLVSVALLLIAAALYASSFAQDFSDVGDAHSPMFFPRIVLALWMVFAAAALVQDGLRRTASTPIDGLWRLAILVAAVVAYTNLIDVYGFFLTSAVFAVVSLLVFGIRNPVVVGLFALATPGALTALFNHILGMPLPTAPFTHWF